MAAPRESKWDHHRLHSLLYGRARARRNHNILNWNGIWRFSIDLDVITSDNSILTIIVVPSNETEITFPDLTPSTLYSCYASANTSAGEGNFTVQLKARTDDKSGI